MTQKSLSDKSTDDSNDAKSKQYQLVVRTKDTETSLVNSEVLAIPACTESATGKNIFNLVDKGHGMGQLSVYVIRYVSVMTGRYKGVYKFVRTNSLILFLFRDVCCI